MKIAIAGAGALGSRIGVRLKEAKFDVTLIDKWAEHVNNINNNGMEIQTEENVYQLPIKAKLLKNIKESYDLIIVLTKAADAEQMLQTLYDKGAVHKDTSILSMMNGLGHEELLSNFVSKENTFLSVTMWSANLRGPGKVLLKGSGSIDMQRADGIKSKKTEEINEIFNQAKLNSEISENVQHSIWAKASLNSVLNPLCGILDKTVGEFGAYDNVVEMITPLIKEIVEVARGRGINLQSDSILNKIVGEFPDSAGGLHYPSMHQDLARGVQTEVDYLNGKIAEYGKELTIKTPNNDLITHLIHQLEMKDR